MSRWPLLVGEYRQLKSDIATFNDVPESAVPADAITSSGSGLDPDISPAHAEIQVNRSGRGASPLRAAGSPALQVGVRFEP